MKSYLENRKEGQLKKSYFHRQKGSVLVFVLFLVGIIAIFSACLFSTFICQLSKIDRYKKVEQAILLCGLASDRISYKLDSDTLPEINVPIYVDDDYYIITDLKLSFLGAEAKVESFVDEVERNVIVNLDYMQDSHPIRTKEAIFKGDWNCLGVENRGLCNIFDKDYWIGLYKNGGPDGPYGMITEAPQIEYEAACGFDVKTEFQDFMQEYTQKIEEKSNPNYKAYTIKPEEGTTDVQIDPADFEGGDAKHVYVFVDTRNLVENSCKVKIVGGATMNQIDFMVANSNGPVEILNVPHGPNKNNAFVVASSSSITIHPQATIQTGINESLWLLAFETIQVHKLKEGVNRAWFWANEKVIFDLDDVHEVALLRPLKKSSLLDQETGDPKIKVCRIADAGGGNTYFETTAWREVDYSLKNPL